MHLFLTYEESRCILNYMYCDKGKISSRRHLCFRYKYQMLTNQNLLGKEKAIDMNIHLQHDLIELWPARLGGQRVRSCHKVLSLKLAFSPRRRWLRDIQGPQNERKTYTFVGFTVTGKEKKEGKIIGIGHLGNTFYSLKLAEVYFHRRCKQLTARYFFCQFRSCGFMLRI